MSRLKALSGLLLLFILTLIPSFVGQTAAFNIPDGDVNALINAINQANASSGKDEINLAPGGTYTFNQADNEYTVIVNNTIYQYGPNALPQIDSNITINANGATLQRDPLFTSCNQGNELRLFWVNFTGKLTLNNAIVKNSCVGGDLGDGGAIFSQGGTVTVTGSTFTGNQVASAALEGGAITVEAGALFVENSDFTSNKAPNSGGAILVESSTGVIVNSDFSLNESGSVGGAVSARFDADVVIIGGAINANKAVEGGAVAATESSTLRLRGVMLQNNEVHWEGGAAFVRGAELIASENTQFLTNVAGMGGGAISTREGGNATIFDSLFTSNLATATMGGGAINHLGGMLTVVNSSFMANVAQDSMWGGGAIYHNGDRVVVINSLFQSNTAGSDGGAINSITTVLDITGSTFIDNRAPMGGAVADSGSLVAIHSSTFTENKATEGNGGAFIGEGSQVSISNSTFNANTATGDEWLGNFEKGGGAVFLTTDTMVEAVPATITNSTFSGNSTQALGGALYVEESVDLTLSFSTLTGNTASVRGGGFAAVTNSEKTDAPVITASIIVGNTGGDCDNSEGTAYTSSGDNVFGTNCPNAAGDTTNVSPGTVLNTTLADNGGLTKTHALIANSPAIDKGGIGCAPGDQRRYGRVGACDTGAFEFNGTNATFPGLLVTHSNGGISVSEAGVNDSYNLSLTHAPLGNVIVNIVTDREVNVSPNVITFTESNWNTPQTVTVSAQPDFVTESAHNSTIAHYIDSADIFFNALPVDVVTAAISADTTGGGEPTETPTTPTPTATVSPEPEGELTENGGFEQAGTSNSTAAGWAGKNLSGDKRKCNKLDKVVAFSGQCAYQFKGGGLNGMAEKSQVSQKAQNLMLATGDTLTLSAWVNAKSLPIGVQIRVKVAYTDGTNGKISLPVDTGTYSYKQIAAQPLSVEKPANSLKLTIRNRAASGKFLIDDVSLVHNPVNGFGTTSDMGLLALPTAEAHGMGRQ
jgi:predicted outer membrane repeat protein